MGVILAKKSYSGHSGGFKWDPVSPVPSRDNRTRNGDFKEAWRVDTSSENDHEGTIADHFRDTPSLPYLGEEYEGDSASLCHQIEFKRNDKHKTNWQVVLSYKPSGEENETKKPDEDGKPSRDPLEWRPEVDITQQSRTVPAWKATFRSGISALNDGDIACPCNAALEPYDPPAEDEIFIQIIRVTRNKGLFDGAAFRLWVGTVNDDDVNIVIDPCYVDTWHQYCAKVANIGGRLNRVNGIDYFATTTEVHLHPTGWRLELPNIGFHARAKAGDPDGRGQSISNTDLLNGMARQRRITDKFGKTLSKPIPLDADGKPLDNGLPTNFTVWSVADEVDFTPLKGAFI